MKIGINIRVMGTQSSPEIISSIIRSADQAGIESAWIVDHIAIPPDDSEGSGGRYLDPLATLAWLAAQTTRIKIGTSVLILPYRPKLPTAKSIATIQELSGERLLLGVGAGWMEPEFKALGVPRSSRGRLTDETLQFINDCFANEVVNSHGQDFIFSPRPSRPPIYIGGGPKVAIDRALRYGDGWLPMGSLEKLKEPISDFRARAVEAGHPGEVVTFGSLDDEDEAKNREMLGQYADAGVSRLVIGKPYETAEDWMPTIEMIARLTEDLPWN